MDADSSDAAQTSSLAAVTIDAVVVPVAAAGFAVAGLAVADIGSHNWTDYAAEHAAAVLTYSVSTLRNPLMAMTARPLVVPRRQTKHSTFRCHQKQK